MATGEMTAGTFVYHVADDISKWNTWLGGHILTHHFSCIHIEPASSYF